jgi:hypothetical protein
MNCLIFAYRIILHVHLLLTHTYYYTFYGTVLIHIKYRCISLTYETFNLYFQFRMNIVRITDILV